MDITTLGAVGELVGGVAVVASLIYVGLQVHQNTVALWASSGSFAEHVDDRLRGLAEGALARNSVSALHGAQSGRGA